MQRKTNRSFIPNFHTVFHALPDIDCTAVFHIDYFEVFAVSKRVFTYFLERAGKHDLFDSATMETLFSDILHAVRNPNAFEISDATERLLLNSLQRSRQLDTTQCTVKKSTFPQFL